MIVFVYVLVALCRVGMSRVVFAMLRVCLHTRVCAVCLVSMCVVEFCVLILRGMALGLLRFVYWIGVPCCFCVCDPCRARLLLCVVVRGGLGWCHHVLVRFGLY